MGVLGHECEPDQWRWFIGSSKVNLKLVLLHNENRFPSVPLARVAKMKESYESMKLLLGKINPLTPNDHYSGRTAPLTSKVSFYVFIQQIQALNILNMVYTLRFFLFKMQFVS